MLTEYNRITSDNWDHGEETEEITGMMEYTVEFEKSFLCTVVALTQFVWHMITMVNLFGLKNMVAWVEPKVLMYIFVNFGLLLYLKLDIGYQFM